MDRHESQIQRLREKRDVAERGGDEHQSGIATNFPKNPPPKGLAYSANFARAQKGSRFAVQVRG
jgi:hypothetical protein